MTIFPLTCCLPKKSIKTQNECFKPKGPTKFSHLIVKKVDMPNKRSVNDNFLKAP